MNERDYAIAIAAIIFIGVLCYAFLYNPPQVFTTPKAQIETTVATTGIVMHVGDRVTFPLEVTNLGSSGNIRTWAKCTNVAPTVIGDNNLYASGQKLNVTVILEAMNPGPGAPCEIYACDATATAIDATCDTLPLDVNVVG